jgi:hypothetical protein
MQSEEELENSDMIGVVKIKDGLFICDEFGAQVRNSQNTLRTKFESFDFKLRIQI